LLLRVTREFAVFYGESCLVTLPVCNQVLMYYLVERIGPPTQVQAST
jgi:hypothetical protein